MESYEAKPAQTACVRHRQACTCYGAQTTWKHELHLRLFTPITVENDCLYGQSFTNLDLLVSDSAPHSVPVDDGPTMWCWSGHSKESAPLQWSTIGTEWGAINPQVYSTPHTHTNTTRPNFTSSISKPKSIKYILLPTA